MPIDIAGIDGTLRAMKKFDEDLYKGMQKQIKDAMMPIRNKARSFAPSNGEMLSGWTKAGASTATINYRAFPKYDQTETKKGIVYRQGKNKRNKGTAFNVSNYVANNSAGGAIYETSGRLSGMGGNKNTGSLNPDASLQFLSKLGPYYGISRPMQGRLIYRAWAEDQGRVTHGVLLAINTAVKTFNATQTADTSTVAA